MYTCVCNKVSDAAIRNLIETGNITNIQELMDLTSVGNNCGACIEHAKDIIESYMILDIKTHK